MAGEPPPRTPGGGEGFYGGGVEAKEHKGTVAGRGGGSFNGGTKQGNYEGVRRGDGKVIIKLIK